MHTPSWRKLHMIDSDDGHDEMTFGQVIRNRRIELGLTQETLADRVGESVRQSDISRLERDYVMLPRRDRLEALARALEVSPGYLLFHSGWITRDEQVLLESRFGGSLPVDPPEAASSQDVSPLVEDDSATVMAPDHDEVWSSRSPHELQAAIARAREVSRQTTDIIRTSMDTIESARRSRRSQD
jgi:transcriptional regulator with XRE-family HTH domain